MISEMDKNIDISFEDVVWNRIADLLNQKKIKQSWLVRQCKEKGMPISQPELSKLYNGKKKINVYELAAISKVLEVPVDFFVSGNAFQSRNILDSTDSSKLLCNADSEQFQAYIGEYHIYYNTTAEQEEKLEHGSMSVNRDNAGYCNIELMIHTGEYRGQRELIKKYEGRMLITALLSGAYIILRNDSIGELCFMAMRHRTFTIKQLECRIALCLTIGSGENKLPTAHRMLLSRKELSDERLKIVCPYLRLYGNEIRIEKNKAAALVDSLEMESEKGSLEALWKMLPEKKYYEVSIELIRRHLRLDRDKFALFIANLLQMADTEPYAKIYESDDNLMFSVITQPPDD